MGNWILRHFDLSLNVAPESSGARDHEERSGPSISESSEGLWSWGPRCCSQQSQRSVQDMHSLIKASMSEGEEFHGGKWTACFGLLSSQFFIDSLLFFFLLEFCENLPEDNREQIIMTHILPCVKVKNKPFCQPHWHISVVLHFSVEQKTLWFAMSY